MSRARSVMVLGCTSDAGKSWLATALCRWYARQGLRVAPFKAQNMSNHARVVSAAAGHAGAGVAGGVDGIDGAGEMGSAQYFQALAAGCEPEVAMNPVLLKPEADTRSQVVVMGRHRPDLGDVPWRERSALLWPLAEAALQDLRSRFDLLVIEGAGSPAEINLAANDYVNTATALAAEAACLLVADIDRGGAFAHLYGTHALMDAEVRSQLRGFVLNKFRGDAALLAPAPEQLQVLTGVPTLAVLPMWHDHGLPEEDAVPRSSNAAADGSGASSAAGPRIVVLAGPHASNLDEFEPLQRAGLHLQFARDAAAVSQADWLILPGSKHTRADLCWWKERGLDDAIRRHAASGKPLLGICGGLQMLGECVDDPQGLEGGVAGDARGLALLPLRTTLLPAKRLEQGAQRMGALEGAWAALSGQVITGYQIRLGRTVSLDATLPEVFATAATGNLAGGGLGWQRGNVLGIYLHGLFENPAVLQALFGRSARPLSQVFDGLADLVDAHFQPGALMRLLDPR